MLRLPEDDADV